MNHSAAKFQALFPIAPALTAIAAVTGRLELVPLLIVVIV
jgi:hypothetical protein